jgi:hypothetical protein
MEINFKDLRVPATYPVYPPYHEGDYLEEYFYDFYLKNKQEFDKTGYTLIPIYWTNVYITGKNKDKLQTYLNYLPTDKKYFTVSQHDDAVQETLPSNTITFTAGGRSGGLPIPLICSGIPERYIKLGVTKDILCSFVGTISTTSGSRQNLYKALQSSNGFYFTEPKWWTPTVSKQMFDEFINITQRSWFSLAPRGYGLQSFRFFEILQLGSIPVFVYDSEWFPFKDYVDWSTFSVCVHEKNISDIPSILNSLTIEQRVELIKNGNKVYKEFFTLEQTSKYILKTLQKQNES